MNTTKKIYQYFISPLVRKRIEQFIVTVAIVSFLVHLFIIFLVDFGFIVLTNPSELLQNPIAAIYTPFSFILIYEVYLLVYYLPKSMTVYIGKQYEIITLILIRRVFKDLSQIELTVDWFSKQNDLQLTYDLVATLLLFFLLFIFYRLNAQKELDKPKEMSLSPELKNYIRMKYIISIALVPIFTLLALYSFGRWLYENFFSLTEMIYHIKDVNKIFFDEFFTILILIDVLLLLISFLHIDKFNKIIRDSGFIISTILIKLSFGAEGLLNTVLIIVAVSFGVFILMIHQAFEKIKLPSSTD
jgi:hypothetical protein